jgi:hypothetical protein
MQKITAILFLSGMAAACASQNSNPKIQAVVGTVLGHTHPLSMRFADLEAGQRTFVLEESAGHRHELRLNAEQGALLLLQLPVAAESTETEAHVHPVTIYVADD